jgi:NADH pyrophosphatase NudC (nudix superfamily)
MPFCHQCGSPLAEREIDGRMRLACTSDACDNVFWDNPVPVVAAIVEHGGEVILVRNVGWPEKMFGLVSGFLEKGETHDEAVLREVSEELGLQGRIVEFIGCYSFTMRNQLLLVYHVEAEGAITVGAELQEIRKVAPERVRPWPFGTGPAVRDWLVKRGITPAEG